MVHEVDQIVDRVENLADGEHHAATAHDRSDHPGLEFGLRAGAVVRLVLIRLVDKPLVVVDVGETSLKSQQLLTEEEYRQARDQFGEAAFEADMGAEAVREMLMTIDLQREILQVREDMDATRSETKIKRLSKRLKLLESFIESGNKPEWMVLTVLPVLPPDLRPLVPLDGGRFATSDLNDLYRRVINRNNRLRRLLGCRSHQERAFGDDHQLRLKDLPRRFTWRGARILYPAGQSEVLLDRRRAVAAVPCTVQLSLRHYRDAWRHRVNRGIYQCSHHHHDSAAIE